MRQERYLNHEDTKRMMRFIGIAKGIKGSKMPTVPSQPGSKGPIVPSQPGSKGPIVPSLTRKKIVLTILPFPYSNFYCC